jgi:hypothetical protein
MTKVMVHYYDHGYGVVSDRNRNCNLRPKPNIRQQKTTEYSVSAEYSAIYLLSAESQ